jgi:hypothetical protein
MFNMVQINTNKVKFDLELLQISSIHSRFPFDYLDHKLHISSRVLTSVAVNAPRHLWPARGIAV